MTARTGQLRQDNQDGKTMAVEREYLGHDIQLRQDNQDRILRASLGRKSGTTGQLGQDSWDKTVLTDEPGNDRDDRTARK
jgi:hypothetical protein